VLCTTYNHERYLEETLRGFLSQTTTFPFEILIHDDASTDRTQEIVRAWQLRYPTIIRSVLQTENQLSKGRRGFDILFQQARGKYIACCEGDDYWIAPDKLQRQVEFLESHPEFSCAGHNYYLLDETQLTINAWDASRDVVVVEPRDLMCVNRLFWWPTLVFRKTFNEFPKERYLAPVGDQFLTSYLGTFGAGIYFEDLIGAVRRLNMFSTWTPLSNLEKERRRVRAWLALIRFHALRGNEVAVEDLVVRVLCSNLDETERESLIARTLQTLR
jgi:glycosyltransferase involved in cell wall biosynthesis